jgi:hypothetical protein
MNTRAGLWAVLWGWGIPGVRQLALMALVFLVLYGRTGLQVARRGGGLPPWLSPVIRRPAPPGTRPQAQAPAPWRGGDRQFWFLVIVAATAVAAWVVTRTLIVLGPHASS